jgi:hypothetical protein
MLLTPTMTSIKATAVIMIGCWPISCSGDPPVRRSGLRADASSSIGGNASLCKWLVVISTMKLKVLWRAIVPAGHMKPGTCGPQALGEVQPN